MADKVVLIGFMGAGKTTVGARMAAQLDTYQHDLDQIIEQHLGESIQDFFAREGEAAFRTLEAQVLDRQLAETGILSTGGGVVMTPTSRQLLQRTATPVVYLRTQPEELLRRLQGDSQRPLLKQMDREGFMALWRYREPLYQATADVVIDTDGLTIDQIVTLISKRLEQN